MNALQKLILGKETVADLQRLSQLDLSEKRQALYNQLNEELYRYMYRGTPHLIDSSARNYIKQGYTYNSLLYSIINYMATTQSTVKWKLEQWEGGELADEIHDHEFLDLWAEPNPEQTTAEFIEANMVYKLATGNDYIYAPKLQNGINRGKVVKMEVMPAHETTPMYGNPMEPVTGYHILGAMYDRQIAVEDTIHIKYFNPDITGTSPAVGMSPIKALVIVLTQNNDAWMNLASAFQNGAPPGFISRDNRGTNDAEFTKEQAKYLEERFERRHKGPHNANKIAAIGAPAKWNQIGLSPVDLNILESIKVTFVQICNVFKFPAPLLNFDHSLTYNNFLESQKILWTNALKQDLEIIGQKITQYCLKDGAYGKGLKLKPDYSDIPALQANKEEMVRWLKEAFWLKASRKQELMGEEVDPEMDKYFIPAGLMASDEIQIPNIDELNKTLARLGISTNGKY